MAMFKSASSGFLNDVSGVLTDLKWGTKDWPAKAKGKNPYSTLSAELLITPDGAEKPVQQFVPAGFFYPESQSISADGHTLESESPGAIIKEDTEFARFVGSAVTSGMDLNEENTLGGRNFDVMIGYRVTFGKVVDVEATTKFGKRVDKKDAKKSYNRDYLTITAVLGAPVKGSSGPKKATNGSGRVVGPVVDQSTAVDVLMSILVEADNNTVDAGKIKSLVTKHALEFSMAKEQREQITKLIASAEFLNLNEGWAYDAKAKTVSLA